MFYRRLLVYVVQIYFLVDILPSSTHYLKLSICLQLLLFNYLCLPSFLAGFASCILRSVLKCLCVYNCYTLMDSFIIIKCPYFSLVAIFVLMSILSDISRATLALFWLLFALYIFFFFLLLPI